MTSATVRVPSEVLAVIQQLAKKEELSTSKLIAKMTKEYEERAFWQSAEESIHQLRQDPAAWQDYLSEMAEWEGDITDQLANEEPYDSGGEEGSIVQADSAATRR